MFLRIVELSARHGKGPALESVYEDRVIPALEKTEGCMFAGLLKSVASSDRYASLTLWGSENHIQVYNDSGSFNMNLEYVRPYLEESSEWKIQLSKEDVIEYVPVRQERVVKSFPVDSDEENLPGIVDGNRRYLRVLSLKIKPGLEDEFKDIYKNEIQPLLKKTTGCRFSFLVDNTDQDREFLSLTIWNDLESINQYENEGQFSNLLNKVKHTLAELYQWKMALERKNIHTTTSEDFGISKFTLLTGKKFNSQ